MLRYSLRTCPCHATLTLQRKRHGGPQIFRDIKPSNIAYDAKTGLFSLFDFGLMCAADGSDYFDGFTPDYLPAEFLPLAMEGDLLARRDNALVLATSTKVDLYLLGLCLAQLLTGRRLPRLHMPEPEPTADGNMPDWRTREAAQRAWAEAALEALSSLGLDSPELASLDAASRAFLLRLLRFRPEERPSAAEAMRDPWVRDEVAAVRATVAALRSECAARHEGITVVGEVAGAHVPVRVGAKLEKLTALKGAGVRLVASLSRRDAAMGGLTDLLGNDNEDSSSPSAVTAAPTNRIRSKGMESSARESTEESLVPDTPPSQPPRAAHMRSRPISWSLRLRGSNGSRNGNSSELEGGGNGSHQPEAEAEVEGGMSNGGSARSSLGGALVSLQAMQMEAAVFSAAVRARGSWVLTRLSSSIGRGQGVAVPPPPAVAGAATDDRSESTGATTEPSQSPGCWACSRRTKRMSKGWWRKLCP
jgi:Protein kinase domain